MKTEHALIAAREDEMQLKKEGRIYSQDLITWIDAFAAEVMKFQNEENPCSQR